MEKKHSGDLNLPVGQPQSDGTLFWKITDGNASRGMPSFSKLPELQRWQIVLYIRALKPVVRNDEVHSWTRRSANSQEPTTESRFSVRCCSHFLSLHFDANP